MFSFFLLNNKIIKQKEADNLFNILKHNIVNITLYSPLYKLYKLN